MRGISVPAFQVDIDTVTPRIFLHDTDNLREEHILRTVRVIPQSRKDAVCAVIGDGQQPVDVRVLVDVGQHT